MGLAMPLLAALVASLAFVSAAPSPTSLHSDVTILVDNDLDGPESASPASGIILLSGQNLTSIEADQACKALGEELWPPSRNQDDARTVERQLRYLEYREPSPGTSRFWIAPQKGDSGALNTPCTIDSSGRLQFARDGNEKLPALCTHSAPYSNASAGGNTTERWRVEVRANNETLTGYRDRVSFRFLGVRYAAQPTRFTYSTAYQGSGANVSALDLSSSCVQTDASGSEDCLFLNIWTPYLPRDANTTAPRSLRPVMVWIHGGAFTGGSGSDSFSDGGNFASRNDVLVVSINYRVGTLGFLALNDGVTNGNFGLADQVNALDWVIANIRNFGGDPERITIYGQSAGAASVRALMASPVALGKFSGAIPLSGLGGLNYGTTYAKYYTIEEEMTAVGSAILAGSGCDKATSAVECLRQLPVTTLTRLPQARFLVVDGKYLTSDQLELRSGPPLPFHLMMGSMHEDGAPFISYPRTTNLTEYLGQIGFAPPSPRLFPVVNSTGNGTLDLYNMASRLATDAEFRCIDQATVAAGLRSGRIAHPAFYYEFDRSYQTTGWPRIDVCEPPRTATHPHGDPSLPYLRCHSGELYYIFGNVAREGLPARDAADGPMQRLIVDLFGAFARARDPNPDPAFLSARGYFATRDEMRRSGPWVPAVASNLTLRALDWPSKQDNFRDLSQCESLGLGLDYYD